MIFLEEIVSHKIKEIENTLGHIKAEDIRRNIKDIRVPLDFKSALKKNKQLSFIAEIKKASPSKGVIRENFNPVWIAWEYYSNNANCLSVLTDNHFFQGDKKYLTEIRTKYKIPTLRKDFIIDPRQIRESYDMGADAILLIAACLTTEELKSFKDIATEFGLTVLVEIHSLEELNKIKPLNFDLIGINNRNLNTFNVSLDTSLKLVNQLPKRAIKISESGITSPEDCAKLQKAGFDGVLVGEHLMRQISPGTALRSLMKYAEH